MSDEQKLKIAAAHIGKKKSPEHRAAQSAAMKGKASKLYSRGISDQDYRAQLDFGNKWCCQGAHFVALKEFSSNPSVCNPCMPAWNRNNMLRRTYGLTHKEYEAKLEAQGGGCAICGSAKRSTGKRNMMIDHNHATGSVRGILCHSCNAAIERLETVPNWGILAAQYLASYTGK